VPTKPLAYLSYAYPDNQDGFVLQLQARLTQELQVQTGEPARVTCDFDRMRPSSGWSKQAQEYVQQATFLIAIVSPSYFKSNTCRKEFEAFLEKEQRTGRPLMFPLYYVEAREFENAEAVISDTWVDTLRRRRKVDIRQFRFDLKAVAVQRNIASLAEAIRDALAKHPQEESSDHINVSPSVSTPVQPVYIESICLESFRCFKHLELRFDHQSRLEGKWTCIAGINGAGKSSILQALGVALLGNPAAVELGGERLNRMRRRVDLMNRERAEVQIVVRLPERKVLQLEIDDNRVVSDGRNPSAEWQVLRSCVIVGYGATRNLSSRIDDRNEGVSPDVRRLITLFDPLSQLASAEVLLTQKDSDGPLIPLFQSLVGAVLGSELKIERSIDGFLFILANDDFVGAIDLPDGFRAAAAWMMDLCAVWCEKAPELAAGGNPANIQAIVLIDEIDLHLHPSLQRELVPRLRKALPKVQWIVTTHSPLVLSNFDSAEIIALDRSEPSGVRFLDRQIMGFSANDIYEWLMGTPATGVAMEETMRAAGEDPTKQRVAAELLQASPFANDETAKLSVEQMLARLEQLEK
jgi:predicted ATPase